MTDDVLPIYHTFGRMTYWHLIEHSPEGSLVDRAEKIHAIVTDCVKRGRDATEWPIRPFQLRALILEITAAFGLCSSPLPDVMLRLLAWSMDVPESFLADPSSLYSGKDGKGQSSDPNVKGAAEYLDAVYYKTNKAWMPVTRLATEVKTFLSLDKAPSRDSIRNWRNEPAYKLFVEEEFST